MATWAVWALGISDEEARDSERDLTAGRPLVTAAADGRAAEAASILSRHGAYDLSSQPATPGR